MGIEVLVIGTVFTVGAFILFLLLALSMPTEYTISEASVVRYFKAHPTRFQIIFYLMFLAFPLNFGIAMIPRIALFSQVKVGGIIAFIFLMWPSFMYLAHRGFSSFSKDLGISSDKKQRLNPITRATLNVIGWFASITSFCLFIFIAVNGIDTVVRTPLFFFGCGVMFIPFRKSIAIIRGKERTEYKVIILDLDGVIRHLDLDNAERAAQSIGFTYNELMNTIWYNEYSFELLCGRSTREEWWEHVQNLDSRLEGVHQDVFWDEVFEISTYDTELIEYVRGIKDKFRVGILTNCDKKSKIQILKELGDDHPFDYILSSSDFGVAKPNPEIFDKLLDKIGVEAEECVFVDDAIANVDGAQDSGIQAFVYEGIEHLQLILKAWNE